ncbi:MAG: ribonuclease HIII [Verrucomicrobia bacterium]|nr:ribonuclease HIII [Verrucomicrobiota bacterium]
MKKITTYTAVLTERQAGALREYLSEHGYEFFDKEHAQFAARGEDLNLVLYKSGKLVLQGKRTGEFIEFVMEPVVFGKAELGYERELAPELFEPRIGIDESGKGDFFGPLCTAAVYVNSDLVEAWMREGVRDSKSIKSDKKIAEVADKIRNAPGCVHSVVAIGNEAYNRLYRKMSSINRILAWGHARALENIMNNSGRMNPYPKRALSDQFARDKRLVANTLMSLGKQLDFVQRHKAEDDMAVAAASILARDEFVRRLRDMSRKYGIEFPKGASALTEQAGREFVAKCGEDKLELVSKSHFRNFGRILDASR